MNCHLFVVCLIFMKSDSLKCSEQKWAVNLNKFDESNTIFLPKKHLFHIVIHFTSIRLCCIIVLHIIQYLWYVSLSHAHSFALSLSLFMLHTFYFYHIWSGDVCVFCTYMFHRHILSRGFVFIWMPNEMNAIAIIIYIMTHAMRLSLKHLHCKRS